jgi:predicted O-methyltransferase YrrM
MAHIVVTQPWLPKKFMELFESWETKDWKMWEFGSGFSTSWFARRVGTLWSIEHSHQWHESVKKACKKKSNVHLLRKDLDKGYAEKILEFQDKFFDFVLVDGRNRVECLKNSKEKAKKIIALDNGLRERYHSAVALMAADPKWDMHIVEWEDPNVVVKASWHALVWVRRGVKLSGLSGKG